MTRVAITSDLRNLIRIARTDMAGLSQRAAAEKAAGLSEVWWRQIESGRTPYATAGTLARMCYAIGVTPDQLRRVDQDHIAELVEDRQRLLESADDGDEMVSYLMATPGLNCDQREALVVMARALRGGT